MQRILALVADEDVSADGLESIMDIAQSCGALTPDRPAPWRTVMYLADQLETTRPEIAIAARRIALTNLARLEPLNDSVTLARLSDAIAHFQLDAPTCPNCGHVAVRNGACYKCLNCGESLGCS